MNINAKLLTKEDCEHCPEHSGVIEQLKALTAQHRWTNRLLLVLISVMLGEGTGLL